ncbi:hypothetical protein [Candidatus Poriferisocius sp.]|uniref:hypothetical protein n=1 Tax=Candidatus Poriferisocius sp. TaxID=3101276 RepID=UPI003B59B54D
MDRTPGRGCALLNIGDFKRDSHAAKYVVELDARPQASDRLFWLLNDPANEQRLVDAELNGMPALAGVARILEDDPEIGDVLESDPVALRFRQAVGVAIKLKMAKLGWESTGKKGAVKGARHFTKAERYEEQPWDAEAYKKRALAALDRVAQMGDAAEHEETGRFLMEALAETRRAEGRPF